MIGPEGLGGKESKEERIKKLKEMGFDDKSIEDLPKYLTLKKLNDRINKLKEAGFEDPVGLIKRHPQIADLNIQRIRKRIELANRLFKLYQFKDISGISLGEEIPQFLFETSIYKIFFILRTLRELSVIEGKKPSSEKLIKLIKKSVIINPYLMFYYLREGKPETIDAFENLLNFLYKLKKILKNRVEKTINEVKENLPNIIQSLEKSQDPYEKIFLRKLANLLILLKESKERRKKE